jgi:hypothetical protein
MQCFLLVLYLCSKKGLPVKVIYAVLPVGPLAQCFLYFELIELILLIL